MRHSPTAYTLCGFACVWAAAVSWAKLIPQIAAGAPLSSSNFRLASVAFCASTAALACVWLAVSYVGLAHARRGRRTAFVAFARRFGSPSVKRAVGLLAVGAGLFPVAARAATAETAELRVSAEHALQADGEADDIGDIGWGSSDVGAFPASLTPGSPASRSQPGAPSPPPDGQTGFAAPGGNALASPDAAAKPERPQRSTGKEKGRVSGGASEVRTVTVLPGDCLWAIAARDLSGDASRADIASHTQRWFEANRTTLSSPDLLRPGQVLKAPKDPQ